MSVRLFVGNLSYEVTEADLREYFSSLAPVTHVSIPVDRETGKRRGFAFVELSDDAQADEAIRRFNNQTFRGRPIAVSEARARESRPSGGGGGFPRSSGTGFSPMPHGEPPEPLSRGERRNRRFGPDAKPGRGRGGGRGRQKNPEMRRKGPIPERRGGQLFGSVDDYDDDLQNEELEQYGVDDEMDRE